MKANELRIGNLVQCKKGEFYTVNHTSNDDEFYITAFKDFGDCILGKQDEELQPIPITEEWLKKVGGKIDCKTKFGNDADWKPNYPRTEYEAYDLKNKFYLVITRYKWIDSNDEIQIDTSINVVLGELYSDRVDSSDFVPFHGELTHLHQLQNLYFALTGKELEI